MRKQMSLWSIATYMLGGLGIGFGIALVIYMSNGPDWVGELMMVIGIGAGVIIGCMEYEKDKVLFAETEIDEADWYGMKQIVKDVIIAFKYPSEAFFHPIAVSIFATNKTGPKGESYGAFIESTNLRVEISLFEGSMLELNNSSGNEVLKDNFSCSYADGKEEGRCVAYVYKDHYIPNIRIQRYTKKLAEAIEKSLPYNDLDLEVNVRKSSIWISRR